MRRLRRRLRPLVFSLAPFAALGAAACASTPAREPQVAAVPAPPPGSAPSGRVRIDGSPGVIPLLLPLVEAYQEEQPGATVSLGEGLGGKARIPALLDGRIDIALASHGLDMAELARQGLVAHRVALSAVVFAVHAGVGVTGISDDEACALFTGRLTSWRALGGGDVPIRAFARPESEVDTEVVRAGIPCMRTATYPGAVLRIDEAPDMVRMLETTTGALGVTTATAVTASEGKLIALSLGAVAPSPENVASGRYRLTRANYLITRREPSPAVAHFLAFVRSDRGATIMAEHGAVRVP